MNVLLRYSAGVFVLLVPAIIYMLFGERSED
jgi:hypothetical protein